MARSAVSVAISSMVSFGGSVQQPERPADYGGSEGNKQRAPDEPPSCTECTQYNYEQMPSVWRSLMQ